MSTRFLSNLILTLAAGFLVVATVAFTPLTVAWLTFAIATGVVVLGAGTMALRTGPVQRSLSGVALILGVWTIVASLVFAPATVVSLGFASALGFVALGIAGLAAHELTTERVVHSLSVSPAPAGERLRDRMAA